METPLSKTYDAMLFAHEAHEGQERKYGMGPYIAHPAQVAGLVSSVLHYDSYRDDCVVATAWLHDVMEDCGVKYELLVDRFGRMVADGVRWLSDLEQGNRAQRKAASAARLTRVPGWVQTIKAADAISNIPGIALHDPKFFGEAFLPEKRVLLAGLGKAHPVLLNVAWQMLEKYAKGLGLPD